MEFRRFYVLEELARDSYSYLNLEDQGTGRDMVTWRDDWWKDAAVSEYSTRTWVLCPGTDPQNIRHLVPKGMHFVYCNTLEAGELSRVVGEVGTTSTWHLTTFKDLTELFKQMTDASIAHIQVIPGSGLVIIFSEPDALDRGTLSSEELIILFGKIQASIKPKVDNNTPIQEDFTEESLVSELAKLRRENRYYKIRIDRVKRNPLVRGALKGRTLITKISTLTKG